MDSRHIKARTASASEAGSKATQDEGKSKKLSKRQVREMEKKMKKAAEAKEMAADLDRAGTKGPAKVKVGVKVRSGKWKGHERQVEEEGELDPEQKASEEAKMEEAVASKIQQQSGEQRKAAERREEIGDMGTAAANGTRFKEVAVVAVESGKKLSRKVSRSEKVHHVPKFFLNSPASAATGVATSVQPAVTHPFSCFSSHQHQHHHHRALGCFFLQVPLLS